jgi:hypothetical protein
MTDAHPADFARSAMARAMPKGAMDLHGVRIACITCDGSIADANPDAFDALLIPGGRAPDSIRTDENALDFVRAMDRTRSPMLVLPRPASPHQRRHRAGSNAHLVGGEFDCGESPY